MSEKADQARRLNGAKSKGPITPQGKRNSSRNGIRHGMLANSVVMPDESCPLFLKCLNEMIQLFEPQNIAEHDQVVNMAVNRWRTARYWAMERAALLLEQRRQLAANPDLANEDAPTRAVEAFRKLGDDSNLLALMGRYQTRNARAYDQALARFHFLREKSQQQEKL